MKRALAWVCSCAIASAPWAARADDGEDVPPPKRDGGELALLYMTLIEWGACASFFVDGLAQSNNAYASVNGGAALGMLFSAPAGAGVAALIDLQFHKRRGVPATVTTAMLLGLGEGIAWNEYFSNRSSTSFHTYTKDVAWIFGAQTVGLASGLVVAAFVDTTQGRAEWVATTGIFAGLFAGSIAGAVSRPSIYPTPPWSAEGNRNVGITSALAGIAGAAGGIATSMWISPSALRVHLIDVGFIVGATIPAIALIGKSVPDIFAGMAIGSGAGFALTFLATAWLPKEFLKKTSPSSVSFSPFAMPLQNGFQIGIGGTL